MYNDGSLSKYLDLETETEHPGNTGSLARYLDTDTDDNE